MQPWPIKARPDHNDLSGPIPAARDFDRSGLLNRTLSTKTRSDQSSETPPPPSQGATRYCCVDNTKPIQNSPTGPRHLPRAPPDSGTAGPPGNTRSAGPPGTCTPLQDPAADRRAGLGGGPGESKRARADTRPDILMVNNPASRMPKTTNPDQSLPCRPGHCRPTMSYSDFLLVDKVLISTHLLSGRPARRAPNSVARFRDLVKVMLHKEGGPRQHQPHLATICLSHLRVSRACYRTVLIRLGSFALDTS